MQPTDGLSLLKYFASVAVPGGAVLFPRESSQAQAGTGPALMHWLPSSTRAKKLPSSLSLPAPPAFWG